MIKIPKIFHRVWIGKNPIPQLFEEFWQGWIDKHPDWQFLTWTDDNIYDLPLQIIDGNILNRVNSVMSKASDVFRYNILHTYGGIYLDCDFECIKNIEPLIDDINNFAAWQHSGVINNAIMGMEKGSQLSINLLTGVAKSLAQYPHDMLRAIGPFYFTRIAQDFPDIMIFDAKYFYPYLWVEPYLGKDAYPEAYAVHHWAGAPFK